MENWCETSVCQFRFFMMFFGSAGIGTLVAMLSSLVLKYIDLYTNPRY